MAKPKAGASDGGIGHNSEAMEIAVHRHMAAFHEHLDAIEVAQGAVAAAKKAFKLARNAAKIDFTLKILDEAVALERQTDNERQQEKDEAQRFFIHSVRGLPTATKQADLFGGPDQDIRDEKYWSDHGYNAGVRGESAMPSPDMPTQFMQTWLKRHVAGADRLAWSMADKGMNPEKGDADPDAPAPPTAAGLKGDGEEEADDNPAPSDPLLN